VTPSLRQRIRLKRHMAKSRLRRIYGLPRSFEDVKICSNPIFLIGAPRSGTTFLGWSLAHHSWLWTSGESTVIREIFGETTPVDRAIEHAGIAGKGSWLTDQGVDRAELLAHLGIGVNALYTSRSRGKRWLDHTPQNTPIVDLLGDMFPGAVFLHLLRDGRQVVHSMTNFLNALPEERRESFNRAGWAIPWLDFETACETWRDHVETAMRFAAAHPQRCLTVRHSRFVTAEWHAYRDIFRFLEIPFEHRPVAYVRVKRINTSFPSAPAREYWNPWPEWSEEQRRTFTRIAGDTMVRYGLATRDELEGPGAAVEARLGGAAS
jgi:hypothetical protein